MPSINAKMLAVVVWVAIGLVAAGLVISARDVRAVWVANRLIAPHIAAIAWRCAVRYS